MAFSIKIERNKLSLLQLKFLDHILADVNFPKDLKRLSVDELQLLCNDVRQQLLRYSLQPQVTLVRA